MAIRELLLKYDADDTGVMSALSKIGQAHKQTDAEAKTVGQSISGVGRSLTTTLTPAAIATGAVLMKSFDEWHGGISALRVGTGETGQALADLGKDMKDVGGEVTQPLSEVGAVMAELHSRTGDTGKGLDDLTVQVEHLAQITGTDAKSSVEDLTRIFGQWHVSTDQQSSTLDKLFRASQQTGVGIDTLSQSVVQFGPTMQGLGFSFDQSIALLANWGKEGVNVDTVLGSLKRSVGNLTAPSASFVKTMKDFPGLEKAFDAKPDTAGRFQVITGEILKLYNTGSQADKLKAGELAFQAFGKRGGQDLVDALGKGRFSVGALQDQIAHGHDTINQATADTETWGDKFEHLKNKVVGFLGPYGQIGGAIAGGVAAIGPALFGLGQIIPLVGKIGSALFGVAAPAGEAAAGVAAAAGIEDAAMEGTAAVAETTGAAFDIAWLPVIAVVAAVAAAAFLLIKYWGPISRFFEALWGDVTRAFSGAFNFIKRVFEDIRTTWNNPDVTSSGFFKVIEEIVSFVRGFYNVVVGIFHDVVGFVKAWWPLVLAPLTGGLSIVVNIILKNWSTIRSIFTTAIHAIEAVVRTVVGALVAFWKAEWDIAVAVARAVWTVIGPVVTAGINVVKSVISAGINVVKAVWSAEWTVISAAARIAWSVIGAIVSAGSAVVRGIIAVLTPVISTIGSVFSTVARDVSSAVGWVISEVQRLWNDISGPLSAIGNAIGGAFHFLMHGSPIPLVVGLEDSLSALRSFASSAKQIDLPSMRVAMDVPTNVARSGSLPPIPMPTISKSAAAAAVASTTSASNDDLALKIGAAVRAAVQDVVAATKAQKQSIKIREREVFEAMERPERYATLARS